MTTVPVVLNLALLAVLPWPLVGVVNRTKALWGGRRGAPLLQSWYDVRRLLRKQPVLSEVTTLVFQLGPLVLLASTLTSAVLVPVLGGAALLSFEGDVVVLAYLWGLGRLGLMLAALDTGSAFEGMGASREAAFSALLEPAFFLIVGTLAMVSGHTSLAAMLHPNLHSGVQFAVTTLLAAALFVVMQVESARVPVDDPTTHLELTMIHEVMVLDHSGPDLAAIQTSAALKLTLGGLLLANLVNPVDATAHPGAAGLVTVGLVFFVGVLLGCVESLMARLRLRAIPQYIALASCLALGAMLVVVWAQTGFE